MTMGCPLQLRERMGGELTRASKTVFGTPSRSKNSAEVKAQPSGR